MLWLLLDALIIMTLVVVFNEGKVPSWGTAIATALSLSLGFVGSVIFLGPYIGLLSIIPMAALSGVLLWVACDVPIKKAMLAGVILYFYKLGFILIAAIVVA